MSEELTKLIDKTVGKKGRLHVPAYWMHKVLSGIVEHVKEQVEKLKKLETIVHSILNSPPSEMLQIIWNNIEPVITLSSSKPNFMIGFIRYGILLAKEKFAEYTLYCFLSADSYLEVSNGHGVYQLSPNILDFGFYEIKIITLAGIIRSFSINKKLVTSPGQIIHLTHRPDGHDLEAIVYERNFVSYLVYQNGELLKNNTFQATEDAVVDFILITSFTKVSSRLCYQLHTLESIEIGEYVLRIDDEAFAFCENLFGVSLPSSLNYIGPEAFAFCHKLQRVSIPRGVKSMGDAFYGCSALKKVDFSNHTEVPTLVRANAFDGCPVALKIIVPDALYDEWRVASNWSTYASHIVKASEYVETE